MTSPAEALTSLVLLAQPAQEANQPITQRGLLIGLGIVVGALVLGKVVPLVLRPVLRRRRSPSFVRVFSALAGLAVIVVGLLIGLAAAFPSIKPVTVLSSLGVLGIAAGFAFQDILSNLLAGVLLLLRDPFRGGDQITVDGLTGTVVEINLRETVLTTFDGRRLTIPNSTVYSNPILVQTAFDKVRTSVSVGVDYATDLAEAKRLAAQVVQGLDGVLADPAVQVYAKAFGTSTIDLDIRYWTAPLQADVRRVQDAVVTEVLAAFTRAGIDMPDQMMVLQGSPSLAAAIHDRGEITDGGALKG